MMLTTSDKDDIISCRVGIRPKEPPSVNTLEKLSSDKVDAKPDWLKLARAM